MSRGTDVSNRAYAPRQSRPVKYVADNTVIRKRKPYQTRNSGYEVLPRKDVIDMAPTVHPERLKDLPSLEERQSKRQFHVNNAINDVKNAMERIGNITYYREKIR